MADINKLRSFLIKANKSGYGSTEAVVKDTDDNGHQIVFQDGSMEFVDKYYGGEPYAGQEVIFVDGRPRWSMQYRGRVEESADINEVYAVLKKALISAPSEHPYRGPKEFTDGDMKYTNTWNGDFGNFSGHEIITKSGREVYSADYFGGLIDQRR